MEEEYLDFKPNLTDRSGIKQFIEADAGLQQQEEKLRQATFSKSKSFSLKERSQKFCN